MLKDEFIEFGYTEEAYETMRRDYSLQTYTDEKLSLKFKEITNLLISLGYTHEEIIKMTKKFPPIYSLTIENIEQKINYMLSLGYSLEEIVKMTKSAPAIYSYTIENMEQKINDVIKLGYSREEVIQMVKLLPAIYGCSIENMEQKISDVIKLGYTREEVIQMTKILPAIYGYSIENIRQKIEFYGSIGMHKIVAKNPLKLIQSVELSYARYHFYLSRGTVVNMENYNKLFLNNKLFERIYRISKAELLEQYSYTRDLEAKKNAGTV